MKYTFLLPAYKGRYLNIMLQSIKSQTYTDYKVIISDDCSPEDLYEICEPYLADTRFSYRRNEYNMGSQSLVSHWNLLINKCDTEYLILASDDDIYDDRFLEEIDELAQKYPNVNLLRARSRRINNVGEPYGQDSKYEEFESPLNFLCSSFGQGRIHCIGNYVFKTSTLKKNGGFVDFPMAWFSDDATVFSCGLNGVVNTPDILFSFRISPINISNSNIRNCKMAKIKIDATRSFCEWMNSFVKSLSYPNTLYNRKQFENVCIGYRDRVRKQIYKYYYQIDLKSLAILVKWMKVNGFFPSYKRTMLFILKWVNYTIRNGIKVIFVAKK